MATVIVFAYTAILAGLVLTGLSSSALRQRRPELSLDKVLLGMENLGTFLLQEQRKVKQLQRKMSEIQEESELQRSTISKLQLELSKNNDKLEKVELDSGSCHCPELVRALSFLRNNQLPNMEQGLRLEKVNRHRLENVVNKIKAGQEVIRISSDILDGKLTELQTNVSREQENLVRTLNNRKEDNRVKWETLEVTLAELQTNASKEKENVLRILKIRQTDNLFNFETINENLADLQTNLSRENRIVVRDLEQSNEDRQIKFEIINQKLADLQSNLSLEYASRNKLEDGVEYLEYSQQDNLVRWESMDEKFTNLQTNVSMETTNRQRLESVIEILNITQEDTRIKWQSLDERFTDLRTNVHRKICPSQFTKLETGCYFMYSHQVAISPDRARDVCEERNASLVSVETVMERDAIRQYLQKETDGPRHIGIVTSGRRISGYWHWTGNNKQSRIISWDVLENWGPGQPTGDDQDCLGLWWSRNDFFWYDFTCTSRYSRRVMCEM